MKVHIKYGNTRNYLAGLKYPEIINIFGHFNCIIIEIDKTLMYVKNVIIELATTIY